MSFCRFETVKTDNSATCRFYISREVSAVFQKNNYIKNSPRKSNDLQGEIY